MMHDSCALVHILDAMTAFPHIANLQCWGMYAITNICTNTPRKLRDLFITPHVDGIMMAIQTAQASHSDNDTVKDHAEMLVSRFSYLKK